jgi:hypothetical protein
MALLATALLEIHATGLEVFRHQLVQRSGVPDRNPVFHTPPKTKPLRGKLAGGLIIQYKAHCRIRVENDGGGKLRIFPDTWNT